MNKLVALYQLSRVRTIMDSFVFLMALSVIAARIRLDVTVVLVILLNLWILIFSYMINDIEDAEDDSRDPKKAKRNPISAGKLTLFQAYIATAFVAISSIALLTLLGVNVLIIGTSILIVGFFYSWKPFRLKGMRVLDVVSHGYFLAAAQVLLFSFLPGATFDGLTIAMAAGVYLFSIGGDLYNEYRDWKVDQKAGLKNTADLLGFKLTKSITYIFWGTGILLIAGTCLAILLPYFAK